MAFFYGGGLALVVGGVAASLFASSPRRGFLLVGLGGLLMLGFFVYEWSQASNGRDGRGCHDCAFLLGRYWQWYLVLFFGLLNWAAWSLGVGLGAAVRAARVARRELREQRSAG
jgi:hypothetical protein